MNVNKANTLFGPGNFSGNSATAKAGANRLKIPLDNYFVQQNDIQTTTAAIVVPGDNSVGRQVQVTDPSSFSVGDVAILTYPGQIYFGNVLVVAVDVLTFDSLIPFAFPAGSSIQSFSRDLNVDGSVTPQRFSIFGSGASVVQINLTRLVLTSLTNGSVDLSKFADIVGGITNGMMLQGVPAGGISPSNQWNIKTNADIDNITGGDWIPYSAQNPQQGQNGFTARYTYGNPDKHDVIPPVNSGDRIDLIIQDDLTSILQLLMLYAGNQEFIF